MIELLLQAERALSVGLLEQAEILYTQVAEADPRNSIAVVGLARVALERGDEPTALELSRRALTIDPQNAAAQRMVERLEEVKAYRVAAGTEAAAEAQRATVALDDTPEADVVIEPVAEIALTPEPIDEVTLPPEPVTVAASVPAPRPEATPAKPEVAHAPRKRSWLDRLFGRNRS